MSKRKKNHQEQPTFHPISMLPTIAFLIDGQLEDVEIQYRNLLEARDKPHVLDDATVDRLMAVYTEAQAYDEVYEEQLSRWRHGHLTASQQQEVERLTGRLAQLRKLHEDILTLATELKKGTINRILEMSDEEVGLAILSGKLGFPGSF